MPASARKPPLSKTDSPGTGEVARSARRGAVAEHSEAKGFCLPCQREVGLDRGEKVTYGILSTEIINKKGFQLPVTGGFGTLLFSGIGVLLVLAGVAVLFSMKKKNDRA